MKTCQFFLEFEKVSKKFEKLSKNRFLRRKKKTFLLIDRSFSSAWHITSIAQILLEN